MKIRVLGTGDAFTSRSFGSSVAVEGSGGRFLIDCPDLIHRALRDGTGGAITAADIDDIVLTHLHGDHCNGLESFGFSKFVARRRGDSETTPRLWTHPEAAARVWERLAPAMDAAVDGNKMTLADFFDVRTHAIGEAYEVRGVQIETRRTKHPVPATALRLTEGGRSLGWSCDTSFDLDLIEWLSGCDVIVHEVNHPPVHTSIEELNSLPEQIRSKMRLTHLADDFDPKSTEMRVLRDGEIIEI
jgi:ribonuclease BN (tRNA processing enzyme)